MTDKILIIYGSTTGMTEMATEEVKSGLMMGTVPENNIVVKNVLDAKISDLNEFQYILFGSSTWDFGCLQYDFDVFHDELKEFDMNGKMVGVFGTGDKSYGETYCKALEIISSTVKNQGGKIIIDNLDINSDFSDEGLERVREWGKKFAEIVKTRNEK